MSRQVTCPKCESVLRITGEPENGLVRCPSCRVNIRLAQQYEPPEDLIEEIEVSRPRRRSRRPYSESQSTGVVIRVIVVCGAVLILLLLGFLLLPKLQSVRSERRDVAVDNKREEKAPEVEQDPFQIDYSKRVPNWTEHHFMMAGVVQKFPVSLIYHRSRDDAKSKSEYAWCERYFSWEFTSDLSEFKLERPQRKLTLRSTDEMLDLLVKKRISESKQGRVVSKRCVTTDQAYIFLFEVTYVTPKRSERMWVKMTYFRNSNFVYEQLVTVPSSLPKPPEVEQFFESASFNSAVTHGR